MLRCFTSKLHISSKTHTMLSTPIQTTTTTTTSGEEGGATTFSALHPDIIQSHILTRLDGPSLASTASTCSQLRAFSSNDRIWANICRSTWPSTGAPRVRHIINTFPNASRSFFSDAFPAAAKASAQVHSSADPGCTPELISAVDLFHGEEMILSKVVETETESGWFRCSPFRVDLLDPKDAIPTRLGYPRGEDACRALGEGLRMSWIVIDPKGRRCVNVSSREPVWAQRHWLTGEVRAMFATVVGGGERGTASEMAVCVATVTCGGGEEGGEMHVREVSLQVEDMDGTHLNGRDSLGILQRALEGKRGNAKGREGYEEFLERKREREERKVRAERRLDVLCVALAAFSFAGISCLFIF